MRALVATLFLLGALPAGAQETRPAASTVASFDGVTLSEWERRLGDQIPSARIHAAYALAELGPAAAPTVPALRRALADEDAVMRYAAAWALSEIGPAARPAFPDLAKLAEDDPVGDVRWIAAKALRKLGVASARPGEPVTLPR